MTVYVEQEDIYGACGVNLLKDFAGEKYTNGYWGSDNNTPISQTKCGEAGLVMAAFIQNNALCDEAYIALKKRFNIVYESSWRINNNSDNMFKVVMYDGRVKKAKTVNPVTDESDEGEDE